MYKICFDSADQIDHKDYSGLRELGIDMDIFEEDASSNDIINQEIILKRNSIEELLQWIKFWGWNFWEYSERGEVDDFSKFKIIFLN